MGMRADIAKAKLQHGHAGNLQPLAQFVHVGVMYPDLRRKMEGRLKLRAASRIGRPSDRRPMTMNGGGFAGGDFPELGEAAEVMRRT